MSFSSKSFIQKFFSFWHNFSSNKRARFVISALLLSGGLFFTQTVPFSWRYFSLAGLGFLAFILSFWSLHEGVHSKVIWLTTAVLPVFFTIAVALFYFLFPESVYYQIALLFFFGFAIYIIFLTENIFTVASLHTIALFRAAQTVGFLLTLLTAFFLYNTIFSFRLFGWWNSILVLLISFPLSLQFFWVASLEEKMSRKILFFSLLSSLVIAELSLVVSFFPLNVLTGSLFLTCVVYVSFGLCSAKLKKRLFEKVIKEYLLVGGLMFLVLLLTASWTS